MESGYMLSLEDFSEEIVLHVFSFLGNHEKLLLTMTSKMCRRLAMDYSLELVSTLFCSCWLDPEKRVVGRSHARNWKAKLLPCIGVLCSLVVVRSPFEQKLLYRVDIFFPNSPEVWKEIALCYRHDDDIESSLEALLVARKVALAGILTQPFSLLRTLLSSIIYRAKSFCTSRREEVLLLIEKLTQQLN